MLEHLHLVRRIAQRVHRQLPNVGVELDDLIGAGNLGLVEAWKKYDGTAGAGFRTFARFRIHGAILDYLRTLDLAPRHLRRFQREADRARASVTASLGRDPDVATVAAAMGISPERYISATASLRSVETVSLEAPVVDANGNVSTLADTLGVSGEQEAELLIREHLVLLRDAVARSRQRITQGARVVEKLASAPAPQPAAVAVALAVASGVFGETLETLPTADEVVRELFLEAVRRTRNITAAADAIGVGKTTAYRWAKNIPAVAEAREMSCA